MRVFLLAALFYLPSSLLAEDLKDPWTRDEDISNTIVTVDISKKSEGFFEYVYTIKSDASNKGKITTFSLNLSCEKSYEGAIPEQNDGSGYVDLASIPSAKGLFNNKRTPAAISALRGNARYWSFDINNYATWSVAQYPGDVREGLKLVSPVEPGLRNYILEPYLKVRGWDYPEEEDPDMPWVDDFTVTGMIAGPGCPGVTPPVDMGYFPGSKGQAEPDEVNELLTYTEPTIDRWHVDESVTEVTISINYSREIDPKTFKVEPAWARRFFDAQPGTSQTVTLPLKQAINKFKITVSPEKDKGPRKADESHHSYHDRDDFEIRRDMTVTKSNNGVASKK